MDLSAKAALERDLVLSRARSTARAGDLDEAARLLDELDADESVDVLDLRARVHAQRGRLAEADACWTKVQALAPEHRGAAAGRKTIARITEHRRPFRPLVHPGWAMVAGVAVTCAVLIAGVGWAARSG